MFQLDNHSAKVANFNPRAEKHGDDNKLAADIKFELCVPNSMLDAFDKGLRGAMFRKAGKGEQQDLIGGADALVAVKFPKIGALRWDEEFPGYDLAIAGGLGVAAPLELTDITLKKFSFEFLEGGSVAVSFNAICHPEADEAGALCALIQEDVEITLTPPSAQGEQLPKAA